MATRGEAASASAREATAGTAPAWGRLAEPVVDALAVAGAPGAAGALAPGADAGCVTEAGAKK